MVFVWPLTFHQESQDYLGGWVAQVNDLCQHLVKSSLTKFNGNPMHLPEGADKLSAL